MNFIIQSVGKITRSPILLVSQSVRPCFLQLIHPSYFHTGIPLFAEPMKKKKKLDPQLVKAREERRRKRLEKSIKKLEKSTKQLKPLEETELPVSLRNEAITQLLKAKRAVPETVTKFSQILKPWTDYCYKKVCNDELMFQRLLNSKTMAMKELKSVSSDLYSKCLKVDENLLPYSTSGPRNTAALVSYRSPDGEWIEENKSLK